MMSGITGRCSSDSTNKNRRSSFLIQDILKGTVDDVNNSAIVKPKPVYPESSAVDLSQNFSGSSKFHYESNSDSTCCNSGRTYTDVTSGDYYSTPFYEIDESRYRERYYEYFDYRMKPMYLPYVTYNYKLSKRKGGQVRFNNEQSIQLEDTFATKKYLTANERKKLALSLRLSERQVKTWFQNRRAKCRRLQQKDTSTATSGSINNNEDNNNNNPGTHSPWKYT